MTDWTQYKGDPTHTGYRPTLDGPMRIEEAWSATLNGVVGSPVLDHAAVYVGTDAGNLYAFDRDDGHRRWVHETIRATGATPVAADDHVFFVTEDAVVTALETIDGREVWSASADELFEGAPRPSDLESGSAANSGDTDATVTDGVTDSGDTHRGDTESAKTNRGGTDTGRTNGETTDEAELEKSAAKFIRTPSTVGSSIDTSPTSPANGNASNPPDSPPDPAVAFDRGTLFVAIERGLLTIESSTGQPLWAAETDAPVVGVPAVDDRRVYVGTTGGSILALDVETGSTVWEAPTSTSLVGGPTLTDDRVYVATAGGTLLALDGETGQTYFTYDARTAFTSSPTVVEESVFVPGADGYLHVTDTTFGNRKLRGLLFSKKGISLDGTADTDPVVAGEVLCLGDSSRRLYGIDALDPEFLWHHTFDAPVSSTPALAPDRLFVGLENATLCCLRGDPDARRA